MNAQKIIFAALRAYLFLPLKWSNLPKLSSFFVLNDIKNICPRIRPFYLNFWYFYTSSHSFSETFYQNGWIDPPNSSKKKVSFYHWIHLPYPDTSKILNFCYSTQNFIFLVKRKTKKSVDWKLSLFTLKLRYSVGQKTFFLTYF